ncbi:dipeptidyl aminopeptidase V [Phakopsora pachyrhizi]|nr:dipeptidyl aminopeptidase V [Phakopsora pachyrhizi]
MDHNSHAQLQKPFDPISTNELTRPSSAYHASPSPTANNSSIALISASDYDSSKNKTQISIFTIRVSIEDKSSGIHHKIIKDRPGDSSFVWLDSSSIIYTELSSSKPAVTQLSVLTIHGDGEVDCSVESYIVGELPSASISNLSFQPFPDHHTSLSTRPRGGTLAFTSQVYPPYDDDSINNVLSLDEELEKSRKGSSAQVYDTIFVRHWDQWINPDQKRSRLFVIELSFSLSSGRWSIDQAARPRSPFPLLEVPVGPFGGKQDFDLSSSTVVITSKDPNLNPAWHTRQNIYIAPLYPKNLDDSKPMELTSSTQGATSSPVFSPSAKLSDQRDVGRLAWLEMARDGYESDRNVIVLYDLKNRHKRNLAQNWDRSPKSIVWGKDDDHIFLLAEDQGVVKAFLLKINDPSSNEPNQLTSQDYSVSTLQYLPSIDRVLLTVSSFQFPNKPLLINYQGETVSEWDSLAKVDSYYLDKGESFWFDGAYEGQKVHGYIIRPSDFKRDSNQKWPLLFLIHGGPQSAWNNSWSLRWNPNTFASKGYIVAMINPTGSTGYGQKFTDSINQNWGGKPYKDLVAGYEYLLENYPEIDKSRTAALGASYGGYMVNWIMGHNNNPLNFKAFVTHDGIFNTTSTYYSTEELYFPEFDHGGTPSKKRSEYEMWNPMNFVSEWKTPCLVIHSQKDYRLPEAEGLSVFNALQRQGIPSRFLYFPDENHWVSNPANSIRWYQEIFKFLGEWCPPGSK